MKASKIYAVSKVRLDDDGRVTQVYWGEVDPVRNAWVDDELVSSVAEAVFAIHRGDAVFALFPTEHGHLPDRRFAVVAYDDGRETIAFDGPATHEREVHDLARIEP